MEKKIINCPDAPAAVGTYSQAVVAGDTIYVSGQIPIDPIVCMGGDSGNPIAGEDTPSPIRDAFNSICAKLP